jgi:hypothetical protein
MYIAIEIRAVRQILVTLQPAERKLLQMWLAMRSQDAEQYYFRYEECIFLQRHIPINLNALKTSSVPCAPAPVCVQVRSADTTRLLGQQLSRIKQTWLNKWSRTHSPIS